MKSFQAFLIREVEQPRAFFSWSECFITPTARSRMKGSQKFITSLYSTMHNFDQGSKSTIFYKSLQNDRTSDVYRKIYDF